MCESPRRNLATPIFADCSICMATSGNIVMTGTISTGTTALPLRTVIAATSLAFFVVVASTILLPIVDLRPETARSPTTQGTQLGFRLVFSLPKVDEDRRDTR